MRSHEVLNDMEKGIIVVILWVWIQTVVAYSSIHLEIMRIIMKTLFSIGVDLAEITTSCLPNINLRALPLY